MAGDSHYQAAEKAAQILEKLGFDAYIIGGAVRDLLLGHPPKDYDLVTNATPDQLQAIKEFKDPKHTDPAQAYGVTRTKIQIDDELIPIEITTYRKDIEAHLGRKLTKVEFSDIADDVARRDFTINALALDPLNHYLLDEVNGLADLNNKFIRFIGNPTDRIAEDPLRLLRAIRFKSRLGFRYSDDTFEAINKAFEGGQVKKIAVDRIRQELSAMLVHPTREEALQDLETFGLIDLLLPELAQTKGVAQPTEYHSEGDVFTHSLLAVRYLPEDVTERLVWATLLHDIGKAPTFTPAEITGDRIRFSDHHSEGAKLTRNVLERLNFGKKLTDEIVWMVHYHMSTAHLPEMRPGHARTFMSHPAFADLLELLRADAHAGWSKENGVMEVSEPNLSQIEKMYQDYLGRPKPKTLKQALGIDGNWLLKNFPGIHKDEQLGKILEELNHLYAEGELKNEEDIINSIKELIENN